MTAFLVLGGGAGCEDNDKFPSGKGGGGGVGGAKLAERCEPMAKKCGDSSRLAKLVGECTLAATKLSDKGCVAEARAAFDCYEKKLCGKGDKVWALDDFRVLAERNKACLDEREAIAACLRK
jgi:hypothetical protein